MGGDGDRDEHVEFQGIDEYLHAALTLHEANLALGAADQSRRAPSCSAQPLLNPGTSRLESRRGHWGRELDLGHGQRMPTETRRQKTPKGMRRGSGASIADDSQPRSTGSEGAQCAVRHGVGVSRRARRRGARAAAGGVR